MNLLFWKKKKYKYSMDLASADQTLQNVFAACEKEPNKIPFDKLLLRQKTPSGWYHIGLIFAFVGLLGTLLAPLTFPNVLTSKQQATLQSHYAQDGMITFVCDGPRILPDNSYMCDADGNSYTYESYGKKDNSITFPYPSKEVNVYLYFRNGQTIQLLLSPEE